MENYIKYVALTESQIILLLAKYKLVLMKKHTIYVFGL